MKKEGKTITASWLVRVERVSLFLGLIVGELVSAFLAMMAVKYLLSPSFPFARSHVNQVFAVGLILLTLLILFCVIETIIAFPDLMRSWGELHNSLAQKKARKVAN